MIASMLEKLGTTVPKGLKSSNVAAVTVTCRLDPMAPEGSQVDVVVSSMLGASSLEGGVLIMTPLQNHQGILSVLASGSDGGAYLLYENGNMAYSERISLAHITKNDLERGFSE